MKVFAGEFEKIYDPSFEEKTSWYINDHCLIYGKDEWHLFGIIHEEPCDPLNEKCCAHSICDTLTGTYRKQMPFPIVADPNRGEAHFWAPHVIEANEVYYMFWCAGSLSDHMTYQIKVSTSLDLYHWEHNSSSNPIVIDGYDARDPMVVKIGGKWILYYTATSSPNYGNHVVKCVESEDLINWGNPRTVFTDPSVGDVGGPCESPFVVYEQEKYYLFICQRDGCYDKTAIYESEDPFHFVLDRCVGDIPAHAAEVVKDGDGKYYVTRAGWGRGGVYIAPLFFDSSSRFQKQNKEEGLG